MKWSSSYSLTWRAKVFHWRIVCVCLLSCDKNPRKVTHRNPHLMESMVSPHKDGATGILRAIYSMLRPFLFFKLDLWPLCHAINVSANYCVKCLPIAFRKPGARILMCSDSTDRLLFNLVTASKKSQLLLVLDPLGLLWRQSRRWL